MLQHGCCLSETELHFVATGVIALRRLSIFRDNPTRINIHKSFSPVQTLKMERATATVKQEHQIREPSILDDFNSL